MPPNSNTCSIPLTQSQTALCDAEDYEALAKFKWFAWWSPLAQTFYACRWSPFVDGKRQQLRMHRQILGEPEGLQVDHRDGNGLNNRRGNLRTATTSQNACNRKVRSDSACGFKGVGLDKRDGRYHARIQVNGKRHILGHFKTAQEAGAAYAAAVKNFHGDYASW